MIEIIDRQVEFPRRFKLVPVDGQENVYDLEQITGTVTQEGTPINKGLFDSINSDLNNLQNLINTNFDNIKVKNVTYANYGYTDLASGNPKYLPDFDINTLLFFKISASDNNNSTNYCFPQTGNYICYYSCYQSDGYSASMSVATGSNGAIIKKASGYSTIITGICYRVS